MLGRDSAGSSAASATSASVIAAPSTRATGLLPGAACWAGAAGGVWAVARPGAARQRARRLARRRTEDGIGGFLHNTMDMGGSVQRVFFPTFGPHPQSVL